MANELIQQFKKYMKNGKIEQFQEYITKNNLTKEFQQQCFLSTYRRGYQQGSVEYKEAKDLSNFLLKLSEDTFKQKFGLELSDKFIKNIYEEEQPSVSIFNTFMLMDPEIRVNSEYEARKMIELFDMATKKDSIIGTHIIGLDNGEELAKVGISLSGHKWVANDYDNRSGNAERTRLEKNISFFDNDPIGFLTQMIKSRGYNNTISEFNDIMIVEIPREELDRKEPNLLVQRDFGYGLEDCLNPEYIKGFARRRVNDGLFAGFYENPLFKDKSIETYGDKIQSWGEDDWKNKFEGWYEQSNTTRISSLKNKVMSFLRSVKGKNRELPNEQIR